MANVVATRALLVRMGFTDDAAGRVVAADGQGLSNIEDFQQLDEKTMELTCKGIRRPGGAEVGTQVSSVAEMNFKNMINYMKHFQRINRTLTQADITLVKVRSFCHQTNIEDKHTDPTEAPKLNPKNWPLTIESIVEYIGGHRGVEGHPLIYCLRDEIPAPAEADDPMKGQPNSKYKTHDQEMIARGNIVDGVGLHTEVYFADNKRVWTLLCDILKQTTAWPHMKAAKKDEDGRQAYKLVYANFLGPCHVDHMAAAAESVLANWQYKGESPKHNFETFSTKHVEQHNILESLVEFGYHGMDQGSKVRHLNNGIVSTALDTVKTRIISDGALRNNFAQCVILYKDYLKQSRIASNATRGISALTLNESGDSNKKVTFKKVEDKWYEGDEWKDLSAEDQEKVRSMRKNRGVGKKDQGHTSKSNKKWERKIKALTRTVSRQKRQLSALKSSDGDDGSDDGDDETGNRHNPALTRQKKKRK